MTKTNKYVKLIGVSAVLMMALIATMVGVNWQTVNAQESERDCAAVLQDAAARVRAAVEAGEMTADEGRARLAGLRERCNRSDNDGEWGEDEKIDDCTAKYHAVAARIRAAVEDGQLTEEQARAKLVAFRQELGQSCNASDRDGERGEDKRHVETVETVANMIGIDARTLWGELKEGKSIAEIAQANGVDPQMIIDALVAEAQADIDEAVAAERLSAEKAAEWSAKLEERFTYYINETPAVFERGSDRDNKSR